VIRFGVTGERQLPVTDQSTRNELMSELLQAPVCEKCGTVKVWQHPQSRKKGWWECRQCKKEYAAEWRRKNPEKYKAGAAAYARNNSEKIKANNQKQYRQNRDQRLVYASEYWRKNKDKAEACIKAAKAKKLDYYKAMDQAQGRKWRAANPELAREQCRRYKAKKHNAIAGDEVTPEAIGLRFALTEGCCCYCGVSKKLEAEHVVALNAGGLHTPSNILGACRSCNASKADKPVESWYRAQSFFSKQRWQRILEVTSSEDSDDNVGTAAA